MRSLGFTGVVLLALASATPALADADSGVGAPPVVMPGGMRAPMVQPLPGAGRMLPPRGPFIRPHGRTVRYVAPSYGYQLPRTWMAPTYFIGNWGGFGLARPAPGFGWSRYYDDAVLTDQWGRVYDWRQDMRWDGGYDDTGYDDGQSDYMDRRGERRGGSGIGGAVAGAVVGGIAGNVIGGRGNRLPGTLIGGGLGALAGQAIDKSSRRHRHSDRDRGHHRGDDYGRGGWSSGPHWGGGWSSGSSWSGGYDSGGTTVTTVVIQPSVPVMQTHTVTSYEYVTVKKRRAVKRHYRPRPKPRCVC